MAADEPDRRRFCAWNVRDSKLVPPRQRDVLAQRIKERCWFSIRVAQPPEIDAAIRDRSRTLNGLELEMMADLLREFRTEYPERDAFALLDAPSINAQGFLEQLYMASGWDDMSRLHAMHHADTRNRTVGAASIIAKAERERRIAHLKQELGTDFGSGYCHDERTIAHVKTAPEDAVHIRWMWSTARDRHAPLSV